MDIAKGYPIEGNPVKEYPHNPPNGESVKHQGSSSSLEEEIYAAYPKKIGKPAALRTIRRALAKHPPEFLLARTRLFASTFDGEQRFIPYPSRWFGEERFNDDPSTWAVATGSNAKAPPAIVRGAQFGQGISEL